MSDVASKSPGSLSHEVMLVRLNQFDQMREFFIQMWLQNPQLAKQGGKRVRDLLSAADSNSRAKL